MAILHFPLGSHLGKLTWDNESEKLTPVQIENASYILHYMGYNIYEDIHGEGLTFSLRLYKEIENDHNFRNILFDFVLLFRMMNINLPDLEYSKAFLMDYYIPFNKKNKVSETRAIVYNDTIYLTFTDNYMVSGKDYPFQQKELYINHFNDGEDLLPIIAKDILENVILRIKIDVAEGEPLNDHYATVNIRETEIKQTNIDDDLPF